MQHYKIPYADTGFFSKMMTDYLGEASELQPFYKYAPKLDSFDEIIAQFEQYDYDRENLVEVLNRQYEALPTHTETLFNIRKLLQKDTYVVVTGHQTNLFTGHLYFVYKILTTINLAEQLKARYPDKDFVPMYWMGSEDHDFAEINHAHIFGKTLSWDIEPEPNTATGRLHTESLAPVVQALCNMLGDSSNAQRLKQLLQKSYVEQATLGDATRYFVNELFGWRGLVIIDQDDAGLRKPFMSILEQELLEGKSFDCVQHTNEALLQAGYHNQAFARPINLFYLTDDFRERIVYQEDRKQFEVLNTNITFSKESILAELKAHPERFSPNVIMRPVYQQVVLPALAYVGGGGETAYWMQLQSTFDQYGVPFPMPILRNSALWIDKGSAKRMKKLGLSIGQLFEEEESLVKNYVSDHSDNQLDLSQQKAALQLVFKDILAKAIQVDATLQRSVEGETKKLTNAIDKLESKLLRAEKRNFDTLVGQIRNLKTRLFPNGTLQERYDNFIPFYLKHGEDFIQVLKDHFQPLDTHFSIFIDEDS